MEWITHETCAIVQIKKFNINIYYSNIIENSKRMFNSEEFHIENTNTNTNTNKIFSLHLKNPNKSILLSLTKTGILLGGTITDNYQTITFRANTVKNFITFFQKEEKEQRNHYDFSLNIFYFIAKQLEYLITKEKKCFYAFKPENILIIDNNKVIYVSEDLFEIEENYLTIWKPFLQKKYYLSPELSRIFSIPSKIHYKTIYYSLALLIINYYFQDTSETINTRIPTRNINKIKGTKLYYALNRCLEENPEKRTLLYI